MEMQEMEIIIDKDGRVQIGVKGVKGEDCLTTTRSLEEAIGEIETRSPTPEFFEEVRSETRIRARNTR